MKNLIRLSPILLVLLCRAGMGQDAIRPRPEAWEKLVPGGRFMDRFLPMPICSPLTADTWGVDAVKPRDITNGIEEDDWSYWGGNIILGDDGRYHLFVCRWPESAAKGHMAWGGSEVVHTVSDMPYGPFQVHAEIGKGHNPEIFRLKDGSYSLYVMGACYRAETLDGPWTKERLEFDARGRRIVEGLSNLSFARREDGSFVMVCRGGGIWISQDSKQPFKQLSDGSVYPKVKGHFEDPVIWRTNIQYHMIVNDWLGRIAYYLRSKDGIHWKVDAGEAYMPGIAVYEDGTSSDWYKYERIKVFQDQYGRATLANFAVIDYSKWEDKANDEHSSKNIVIPLTVGRLLTIQDREKITGNTPRIRVKIAAEPGFDPHKDVDVDSLRFGATEAVNFGGGARPVNTETVGKDLIVVFDGKGHGLTDDNFVAKLLGKNSTGKLLFGYARLPWLNYLEPALSPRAPEVTRRDAKTQVTVEVENFGQVKSEEAPVRLSFTDAFGRPVATVNGTVPPLAPYAKTVMHIALDHSLEESLEYTCQLQIQHPNQKPEVLRTHVPATAPRPTLLKNASISLSSDQQPNAGQGPDNLIDKQMKTKLCLNCQGKPVVIDLILPESVQAVGYAFRAADDVPDRDPKEWEVQASNDRQQWNTVARGENLPRFLHRRQRKSFKLDADKPYKYYRFVFRQNHGDVHFQLSELDLF